MTTFNDYEQFNQYPQTTTDTAGPDTRGAMVWKRGYADQTPLANWGLRFAAAAIDYVPLYLITALFGAIHLSVLGWLAAITALGFNNVYMQGLTGQSLGKRIVGIRTVSAVASGPSSFAFVYPGVGRCLGRQLAHVVDTFVLYLGWLRPLWNAQYRTWADSIASTVVLGRGVDTTRIRHREPGEQTPSAF